MIRVARRLQKLEDIFRVEPAQRKDAAIVENALVRLDNADLNVMEELSTLRAKGELSQLTAAQEEMLGRWQAVLDEEARKEGYACFKECEHHESDLGQVTESGLA